MAVDDAPRTGETVADWLFRVVSARELSYRALARKIGVHASSVGHWISGRSVPAPSHCTALAHTFGVNPIDVQIMAGWLDPADSETEQLRAAHEARARMERAVNALSDVVEYQELEVPRRKRVSIPLLGRIEGDPPQWIATRGRVLADVTVRESRSAHSLFAVRVSGNGLVASLNIHDGGTVILEAYTDQVIPLGFPVLVRRGTDCALVAYCPDLADIEGVCVTIDYGEVP